MYRSTNLNGREHKGSPILTIFSKFYLLPPSSKKKCALKTKRHQRPQSLFHPEPDSALHIDRSSLSPPVSPGSDLDDDSFAAGPLVLPVRRDKSEGTCYYELSTYTDMICPSQDLGNKGGEIEMIQVIFYKTYVLCQ